MDEVANEWFNRLLDLRVATLAGGQRAWHKPFLLLTALERLREGHDRLAPKPAYTGAVGQLLDQFQPAATPGRSRASNPWRYLPNDGLWETNGTAADSLGGLPERYWRLLAADPQLVARSAGLLLHLHLPRSLHDDIAEAVGIPAAPHEPSALGADMPDRVREEIARLVRDPRFVTRVMEIYPQRCTVCHYDGRAGGRPVGLDAAHVRGLADGGPDVVSNGWPLCVLHHRLFDLGMFTVTPDELELRVSRRFEASAAVDPLRPHTAAPVTLPAEAPLDLEQLAWHVRHAFRA